jgi:hypothetical protein
VNGLPNEVLTGKVLDLLRELEAQGWDRERIEAALRDAGEIFKREEPFVYKGAGSFSAWKLRTGLWPPIRRGTLENNGIRRPE